jgi:predicted regulator of Ras-like GTPase activity (Roadblock/LC7/MglB family)
MLSSMDAAQALADLTEISSQVAQVAILDRDGSVLATSARDAAGAERFVTAARRLLDEADGIALARGLPELSQLEVSTLDGSVFAVRRDGRLVVATTRPDPTVGLVFYDLKHCLRSIEEPASAGPADGPADADAAGEEGRPAGASPAKRTPRRKADASA